MDTQNSSIMPEAKKGRSWVMWAVLIIIIALAAIFIFWQGPSVQAPEVGTEVGTEDTTSAIDTQLGGVDLGDLESEFQSIDADLGQL
ncbi:MAG: hypothetical protein Q8P88_02670 [Candidatus Jorgensenbacteria bacterium]|nr:hypothetical protein [Candidatus Jorgensenbacteria bacterium]